MNVNPKMDMKDIIVGKVVYLDPNYRSIVKSMVHFIVDQHRNGLALTGFDKNNIVFHGDIVKFVGVGFDSSERQQRDFRCLYEIVKGIRYLDCTR